MTHGHYAHGQRLVDRIPHGHWETMTFWPRCAATGSTPPSSSTPFNGE